MHHHHANERFVTTTAHARSWVAQEAAKHTTPESRAQRIAGEREMLDFCVKTGRSQFDRDIHQALIDALTAVV